MKTRISVSICCVALAAISLAPACYGPPPPPGVVYVRVRPPAPPVEVVSVSPGPDYVWIRGYHRWEAERYVWVPGRWERRPRVAAVWVPGEWRHHRNGWYWVEGHWR